MHEQCITSSARIRGLEKKYIPEAFWDGDGQPNKILILYLYSVAI